MTFEQIATIAGWWSVPMLIIGFVVACIGFARGAKDRVGLLPLMGGLLAQRMHDAVAGQSAELNYFYVLCALLFAWFAGQEPQIKPFERRLGHASFTAGYLLLLAALWHGPEWFGIAAAVVFIVAGSAFAVCRAIAIAATLRKPKEVGS